MKVYPRAWEELTTTRTSNGCSAERRLMVPGGWLVNIFTGDNDGNAESLVFVPDPGHVWILEDKETK